MQISLSGSTFNANETAVSTVEVEKKMPFEEEDFNGKTDAAMHVINDASSTESRAIVSAEQYKRLETAETLRANGDDEAADLIVNEVATEILDTWPDDDVFSSNFGDFVTSDRQENADVRTNLNSDTEKARAVFAEHAQKMEPDDPATLDYLTTVFLGAGYFEGDIQAVKDENGDFMKDENGDLVVEVTGTLGMVLSNIDTAQNSDTYEGQIASGVVALQTMNVMENLNAENIEGGGGQLFSNVYISNIEHNASQNCAFGFAQATKLDIYTTETLENDAKLFEAIQTYAKANHVLDKFEQAIRSVV